MRALHTSMTLPALAAWHESRAAVTAVRRPGDRLPEHVAVDTYAVLTRLLASYRLAPEAPAQVLRRRFPPPYLAADDEQRAELVTRLASAGVAGGAAYDGLVASTALAHGARRLSRDSRARPTYDRLGVGIDDI